MTTSITEYLDMSGPEQKAYLLSHLERIALALEEMSEETSSEKKEKHPNFCGQTQPHPAHWWDSSSPVGPTTVTFSRPCAGHS